MKSSALLLLLLLSSCGYAVKNEGTTFNRLAVEPVRGGSDRFSASGKRVEVSFDNYSDAPVAEVDAFPEPPVRLRDRLSGSYCEIVDGGVWARDGVYLDGLEQIVLMNEFSGSASDLVAYDTGTCEEIGRLDVSGLRWEINGSEVLLGKDCASSDLKRCSVVRSIDLNAVLRRP